MTDTQKSAAIPDGWVCPPWLSKPGFSKDELRYLCDRLSTANTQLRIVNRRLAAQLEKENPNGR